MCVRAVRGRERKRGDVIFLWYSGGDGKMETKRMWKYRFCQLK